MRNAVAAASSTRRGTTRRQFLKITIPAVGTAALAATGFAAISDWRGVRTYFHWYFRGVRNHIATHRLAFLPPVQRIQRYFDYLTLDERGVQRFVRDYERAYGPLRFKSTENNRALFSRYLLSSDFWQYGGDETRVVRYIALYDPYITPCWNPCARFPESTQV